MKTQVGVEYLFVIGILLAIFTPLMVYVVETLRIESEMYQAQTTADKIANAIDSVSAQGYPAKKTFEVVLPESIADGSGIINYTVVVKLKLSGDTATDVVSYTKTACAFGTLPNKAGLYRVQAIARDNRCVEITTNVTTGGPDLTPPIISGVQYYPVPAVENVNVYITWYTNEGANSIVSYSVNSGPWVNVSSSNYVLSHSIGIGSFLRNDQVRYYVYSCDLSGNCATDNNTGTYYSFTVNASGLTDFDIWQLNFDPVSDFNYKQTGSWLIKVWALNQNMTRWSNQTVRLTIVRIDNGQFAVNNQLMTNNGDGSYQYTTSIPGSWNNRWAQMRVDYDDADNDLDMSYYRVVYVRNSAGSSDRPWKFVLDPSSNVTSVDVSQNFTVKAWLYNAQANPMSGENCRITVHGENGVTVINSQGMTNNGNGSYQYMISTGTLSSGTDYRIKVSTTRTIGGRNYTAEYQYIVEGV